MGKGRLPEIKNPGDRTRRSRQHDVIRLGVPSECDHGRLADAFEVLGQLADERSHRLVQGLSSARELRSRQSLDHRPSKGTLHAALDWKPRGSLLEELDSEQI